MKGWLSFAKNYIKVSLLELQKVILVTFKTDSSQLC